MAALQFYERDATRVDVFAELAHYPGHGRKTAPAIGDFIPLAGVRVQHRGLFLLAIPSDGEVTDAIFGFGVSFDLNR